MISIYCSPRLIKKPTRSDIGGWRDPPCWAYTIPWSVSPTFFTDIDQYLAVANGFRVAFYLVDWTPDQANQPAHPDRESKNIIKLSQKSDLVFVLEHEVHAPCLIDHLVRLKNVYWVMAGTSDLCRDRIIPWQYHLWRIKCLYEELPHFLPRLDPYRVKSWYFDAMLGTIKPSRSLVASLIEQHGLQDRILYSLGPMPGSPLTVSMFDDPRFFLDSDWKPLDHCDYQHLNQHVMIENLVTQMPSLMPLELYNRTAYSIICETGFANDTHMITEKTAKAILGRRLFVIFAGRGFLRYLREQGFRTFQGIIDEDYDLEPNDDTRWRAAFEQVRYLCDQDQTQILQRARPILEHNYARVMSHDLSLETFNQIQQVISQYDR